MYSEPPAGEGLKTAFRASQSDRARGGRWPGTMRAVVSCAESAPPERRRAQAAAIPRRGGRFIFPTVSLYIEYRNPWLKPTQEN